MTDLPPIPKRPGMSNPGPFPPRAGSRGGDGHTPPSVPHLLGEQFETKVGQREAILWRLQRGDVLTPLDALNDPEIRSMKLATRISELIEQGHEIDKFDYVTPSGKRVKAYRMARTDKDGQRIML